MGVGTGHNKFSSLRAELRDVKLRRAQNKQNALLCQNSCGFGDDTSQQVFRKRAHIKYNYVRCKVCKWQVLKPLQCIPQAVGPLLEEGLCLVVCGDDVQWEEARAMKNRQALLARREQDCGSMGFRNIAACSDMFFL